MGEHGVINIGQDDYFGRSLALRAGLQLMSALLAAYRQEWSNCRNLKSRSTPRVGAFPVGVSSGLPS